MTQSSRYRLDGNSAYLREVRIQRVVTISGFFLMSHRTYGTRASSHNKTQRNAIQTEETQAFFLCGVDYRTVFPRRGSVVQNTGEVLARDKLRASRRSYADYQVALIPLNPLARTVQASHSRTLT